MKKTKLLILATITEMEAILDVNCEANIGICETVNGDTVYILGNHLFKSPIEFCMDKTKTMFSLLFYDTLDIKNWSMTLREASHGYFIWNGGFHQLDPEDETGMSAMPVPTKQVMDELRQACENFKGLDGFSKRMEKNGGNVFESFK